MGASSILLILPRSAEAAVKEVDAPQHKEATSHLPQGVVVAMVSGVVTALTRSLSLRFWTLISYFSCYFCFLFLDHEPAKCGLI